ncbi:MAG: glycosyltransferase family 39 protein [Pseudomonadota bacterium]
MMRDLVSLDPVSDRPRRSFSPSTLWTTLQTEWRPARTLSFTRERQWLAAIFLVAIVLRFATLTVDSLWIDEGYTLASAGHSFQLLFTVPFDSHPALHFAVVKVSEVFFDGAVALRLPSAVFSVIMLIPIYFLSRRIMGPVGALVTLAVLAMSFTMLVYANNGRNYGQLLMLLAFALWALHALASRFSEGEALLERGALKWAAVYTVSAILALYTHNTAILYLFVINAIFCLWVMLTATRRFLDFTWRLAVVNVLAIAAWLPWLRVMLGTSDVFDWLLQMDAISAATTLAATIGPNSVPAPILGVFFLAVLAGGVLSMARPNWPLALIFAHAAAFPLFIWLIGFVYKPVFMERIILPAALGGALAIGYLAAHGRRAWLAGGLTGLAVLATAWSAAAYAFRGDAHANLGAHLIQDWRSGVAAHDQPGNALVICDTFTWPTVDYYRQSAEVWVHNEAGMWDLSPQDWRDTYGVAISGANAVEKHRFSPWMATATIAWEEAVAGAPRMVFLKPDFLCNDGEPEILRARLQASGYSQTRLDRWRGLTAEVWER